MLPVGNRMRQRTEFTETIRRGRGSGRSRVVVHFLRRADTGEAARVGFVVGRAVGGAVIRNRVRRRLRHLVRERLTLLPHGSLLVVRANPRAATAGIDELAADLDTALERVLRRQFREAGRQGSR
jgi:ribonuclease P protein component